MVQKMVKFHYENASLHLRHVTDENRKGSRRKHNERQRVIEDNLFLFPAVFTNKLFSTVVPKCVMALSIVQY